MLLTRRAACASLNAQRREYGLRRSSSQPASEISLPIRIGPPDALPRNSFVRIRGLPHVVSLNEGYSVGPGSWALPLHALPTLKANVPAGIAGRSELMPIPVVPAQS